MTQQQQVKGDWGLIRCTWENWIKRNTAFFVLLKDESEDKSKQYFSRLYGLQIANVLTTYRIEFIYDRKTKMATVSCDNIISQVMAHEKVDEEKLVASIEKSKVR